MSSTEKKTPLIIRLMIRFFTIKFEKNKRTTSDKKNITGMLNEEETFLFI